MRSTLQGHFAHVVLFTMNKGAPASALDAVAEDCHELLGKINAVRGVKVGKPAEDATPKYARKNYDLALLILVDDAAGLKEYHDDPLHTAFLEKHGKHIDMDRLQVFDFLDETEK